MIKIGLQQRYIISSDDTIGGCPVCQFESFDFVFVLDVIKINYFFRPSALYCTLSARKINLFSNIVYNNIIINGSITE